MKRVLLILGDIVFTENAFGNPIKAEINNIQTTLFVDEDKATTIGESLIYQNVATDFIIPKLYKGKIIFNC